MRTVLYKKWITRQDLKNHPDWYFIFGDNLERTGFGGQAAAMHGEPNAIGIATKYRATHYPEDLFYDKDLNHLKAIIDHEFLQIPDEGVIVIPYHGIGTGLAHLDVNAPILLNYINSRFDSL